MTPGIRVSVTDARGAWWGTVTTRTPEGMLTVKWDSGVTERIHEGEVAEQSMRERYRAGEDPPVSDLEP